MVACAIALALANPVLPKLSPEWFPVEVGAAAGLAALLLSFLFTRWDGISAGEVGIALVPKSVARLLAGFIIGLVIVGLRLLLVKIGGHVRWEVASGFNLASMGIILLSYILLACREEMAFHGYPLRRLDVYFGPLVAQGAVAIVFALEHVLGGVSWTNAFLGAAVGSLLFGMASLATKGLAVPIGLHAAWNFGSWIFGGKEFPGYWRQVVQSDFRGQAELVERLSYIAALGLATLFFSFVYTRKINIRLLLPPR
jgi:membrane protease YdiL (CAAX protease family)